MYLLKVVNKKDNTQNVSININHEYKEFKKLKDLIEFIFTNSIFIESYEIFNRKEFESSNDGINISQPSNCIQINSGNSTCDFR